MKIRESFRAYQADQYEPVTHIPVADHNDDDQFNAEDAHDLLSVDLNTVSNDWLQSFAKEVLKLPAKNKDKLVAYADTTYELELNHSMTVNEMIRSIAIERKKEERSAHEAALAGRDDPNTDHDDDEE